MWKSVLIVLALVIPATLLAATTTPSPQSDLAFSAGACQASGPRLDRVEVGRVERFSAESPHPAPDGWSQIYEFPGAAFVRLHFRGFRLAGGDKLVISSLDGAQVWEYTNRGPNGNGDFWSFATDGQGVVVTLSAPSGRSYGFKIVEAGYGAIPLAAIEPVPSVECGTDGREGIACYANDTVVNNAQKPVARLLFVSGGLQYVCTGELVRGSNANTLITNAHCMDTQKEVSSLQAKFNYQYTACGGSSLAATTDYAGGSLLKTNPERYSKRKASSGLDYTLLTLQGNPESAWGELVATSRTVSVGNQMNFIQHPGGNPKQIGYWEDSTQTQRCDVDTVNATYGSARPNSQMGYACDSEGGSSGSAITAASDGKIIGLHHYGGVSSAPCLNSASMMSLICQDAGGLLQCDNN